MLLCWVDFLVYIVLLVLYSRFEIVVGVVCMVMFMFIFMWCLLKGVWIGWVSLWRSVVVSVVVCLVMCWFDSMSMNLLLLVCVMMLFVLV